MKILFLSAWYPSEENPFEGVFVKEHALAVAERHDVSVIAFHVTDESDKPHNTVLEHKMDGIRTVHLYQKLSRIKKIAYIARLYSQLKTAGGLLRDFQPHILHAHTYHAGVPAVILGRRAALPVAVTEHWSGFLLDGLTFAERFKARFAFDRANVVLPVSPALCDALISIGVKTPVRIVPNAVDVSLFTPVRRKPPKPGKSPFRFIAVGALIPVKGIPHLLYAMRLLLDDNRNAVLDVIGDGHDRPALERLASDLNLSGSITFHGFVSKTSLANMLQDAHCLVLPSLTETFSVIAVEAMATGLPVIASRVGALPDLIDESRGILVPPENPQALKDAMIRMIHDRQNYDPAAISAKIHHAYNRTAVAEQLNDVYHSLVTPKV